MVCLLSQLNDSDRLCQSHNVLSNDNERLKAWFFFVKPSKRCPNMEQLLWYRDCKFKDFKMFSEELDVEPS